LVPVVEEALKTFNVKIGLLTNELQVVKLSPEASTSIALHCPKDTCVQTKNKIKIIMIFLNKKFMCVWFLDV